MQRDLFKYILLKIDPYRYLIKFEKCLIFFDI